MNCEVCGVVCEWYRASPFLPCSYGICPECREGNRIPLWELWEVFGGNSDLSIYEYDGKPYWQKYLAASIDYHLKGEVVPCPVRRDSDPVSSTEQRLQAVYQACREDEARLKRILAAKREARKKKSS